MIDFNIPIKEINEAISLKAVLGYYPERISKDIIGMIERPYEYFKVIIYTEKGLISECEPWK